MTHVTSSQGVDSTFRCPYSEVMSRIRVTMNYHDPSEGIMFWKGDVWTAVDLHKGGAEVKRAGEYDFIPAGCYELLPDT